MRSKPSSRAQWRSACAPKRMSFSALKVRHHRQFPCSFAHTFPLLLQRSSSKLASYQQKMFYDHVGIAIAGPMSDARVLRCVPPTSFTIKACWEECRREHCPTLFPPFSLFRVVISCAFKPWGPRWCSTGPFPVNRLVSASASCPASPSRFFPSFLQRSRRAASEPQVNTQEYGRRPYGIGFLVVGLEPHRPTPVRVLAGRHLRVLRCLDLRAQPECQDLPREAL